MRQLFVILVAALALIAAGCGGGSDESSSGGGGGGGEGGKTTVAGVEAENHGTKDVSGADELEVELDDNYFEPTVIKGSPGQTVKLELENEGDAAHTFTIDDQGVDQNLDAREKADVTVTIPESGQVSFYCRYHRQLGMAGALEAE